MFSPPPKLGRWISTNGSPSITVTDVFNPEDENEAGFWLVSFDEDSDEEPICDVQLDPEEWETYCIERALTPV